MNHLVPCPNCARHVRQSEAACPFCSVELELQHVSPPALPRGRLGRAATFAFGASLVGATSLVACGGESETGKPGGTAGASGASTAGASGHAGAGGSSAGTFNGLGGNIAQPYGVPPFGGYAPTYGAPPSGGSGGTAGGGGASNGGTAGGGGVGGTAGGVGGVSGSGGQANAGTAGTGGPIPVYGAPPKE